MDIVGQVKKIEVSDLIKMIMGLVGVVTPGLLIFFIFKRDLFISLDLSKLILLSISLSLPVVFLNFALMFFLPPTEGRAFDLKANISANLLIATISSALIFYLPLVAAYIFGLHFIAFVWLVIALESVISVSMFIENITVRLKKKNSSA